MINYISDSPLCYNVFPYPIGNIDEAISEGINAPIAIQLEDNLGIAGSVIAAVVCTAIKIISVTLSAFLFLAVLPCYCISLFEGDDHPIEIEITDSFSGPETIVSSDEEISQGLEWVKTNVRKKRQDDPKVEYSRLEKLGYIDPKKMEGLDQMISEACLDEFNGSKIKRVYAEAITISTIFKETHYPFLHAQGRKFSVIQYLIKEIVKRKNLGNTHNTQFLRDPHLMSSLPKQKLVAYLEDEKANGRMDASFDGRSEVQQYLVAADVNLFNRGLYESAFYFCGSDKNIIFDSVEIISKIFRSHFKIEESDVQTLSKRVCYSANLLNQERNGCGNIFLYLLPKERVAEQVYAAEPWGLPINRNLRISPAKLEADTLKSLEHDVRRPGMPNPVYGKYAGISQYRLFTPKINQAIQSENPAERPIVYFITATPEKIRKEMKKEIREIVDMAEVLDISAAAEVVI